MNRALARSDRSSSVGEFVTSKRYQVITCLILILFLFSCRHRIEIEFPELPEVEVSPGVGVTFAASFPSRPGEIKGVFHRFLPDSGIVPVQVTIRNVDVRPLRIHSSNAMALGGNFDGFTLLVDGDPYLPVHPLEALKALMGFRDRVPYRRPGNFGIFAGVTLLPPLGCYYIYKEARVGRYYKPLFEQSLYPSMQSGCFEPITLEPGEETEGYLYFSLPQDRNPYSSADSSSMQPADKEAVAGVFGETTSDRVYELAVRASFSITACDTFLGFDCLLAREEEGEKSPLVSGEERGGGRRFSRCADVLFALDEHGGSGGERRLVVGHAGDLEQDSSYAFEYIADVSSKAAEIADASLLGRRAACALNFMSKSKVYLVDLDSEPHLIGKYELSRKVARVFLIGDGLIVVTKNGFCHLLSGDGMRHRRSIKLGPEIDDTMVLGERFLVFHRKRGVDVYGTSGEQLLHTLGRHPLSSARRKVLGRSGGELVLLHRGARVESDTLVLFDLEGMKELGLAPLPGKVVQSVSSDTGIVLQLEDGTILRSGIDTDGTFYLKDALFIPFEAKVLLEYGPELIAIGKGGVFVRGPAADFYPGALEVIESLVRVELAPHGR